MQSQGVRIVLVVRHRHELNRAEAIVIHEPVELPVKSLYGLGRWPVVITTGKWAAEGKVGAGCR